MNPEKRIEELFATLPWTLGESEKREVRRIIMILLEENDADWEKAMDARIDEIENDRGHE